MLGHCLQNHPNIKSTRIERGVLAGARVNTKHLYNICTTMDQRLRRCSNIEQMLYKCFVFVGIHAQTRSQLRQTNRNRIL